MDVPEADTLINASKLSDLEKKVGRYIVGMEEKLGVHPLSYERYQWIHALVPISIEEAQRNIRYALSSTGGGELPASFFDLQEKAEEILNSICLKPEIPSDNYIHARENIIKKVGRLMFTRLLLESDDDTLELVISRMNEDQ